MGALRDFMRTHPRLTAFFGLAVAMVAALLLASRDVALEPGQRITLVVSTVVLAGLCVWIINWE